MRDKDGNEIKSKDEDYAIVEDEAIKEEYRPERKAEVKTSVPAERDVESILIEMQNKSMYRVAGYNEVCNGNAIALFEPEILQQFPKKWIKLEDDLIVMPINLIKALRIKFVQSRVKNRKISDFVGEENE